MIILLLLASVGVVGFAPGDWWVLGVVLFVGALALASIEALERRDAARQRAMSWGDAELDWQTWLDQ